MSDEEVVLLQILDNLESIAKSLEKISDCCDTSEGEEDGMFCITGHVTSI